MRNLDYIINQINGNQEYQEETIVDEVAVPEYQEEQYDYSCDNNDGDTIPLWDGYEDNEYGNSEDGYVEIQFENDFYEPYYDCNEYQYDNYEDDPFYNSIIDASEYEVREPIVNNYEFDEIDKMVLGDMIGEVSKPSIDDLLECENNDLNDLSDMSYVLDELLDEGEAIVIKEIVKEERKNVDEIVCKESDDLSDMSYVLDELLDEGEAIDIKETFKEEKKDDNSGIDMEAIYKYMEDEKRRNEVYNRPAESNETPFELSMPDDRNDLVNSVIRESNARMKSSSVDLNKEDYEVDTSWVNDEDLFGVNYMHCIAENENEVYEETDFVEGSFSEWMEQNKSKDDFYLVDES